MFSVVYYLTLAGFSSIAYSTFKKDMEPQLWHRPPHFFVCKYNDYKGFQIQNLPCVQICQMVQTIPEVLWDPENKTTEVSLMSPQHHIHHNK